MLAFFLTCVDNPQKVVTKSLMGNDIDVDEVKKKSAKTSKILKDFVHLFFSIKIKSAYDPSDELLFEFRHCRSPVCTDDPGDDDDGGEWVKGVTAQAA